MGPLAKGGGGAVGALHPCMKDRVAKRGAKVRGSDNTTVKDVTVTCFRKGGHKGPHRNGKVEW